MRSNIILQKTPFWLAALLCLLLIIACGEESPLSDVAGDSSDKSEDCVDCDSKQTCVADGTYRITFSTREIVPTDGSVQTESQANVRTFATDIEFVGGRGEFAVNSDLSGDETLIVGLLVVDPSNCAVFGEGQIQVSTGGETPVFPITISNGIAQDSTIRGDFFFEIDGQGILEGTFNVAPSDLNATDLDNVNVNTSITTEYEVTFIREGEPQLIACLNVEKGFIVQTVEPHIFDVDGFVTVQNEFLIQSIPESNIVVVGEGNIENERLRGSFTADSGIGVIEGKENPNCTAEIKSLTDGLAAQQQNPEIEVQLHDVNTHVMCNIDLDFGTDGDGIGGFFTNVFEGIKGDKKAYCYQSSRCLFLDEKIDTFDNLATCISSCEDLVADDSNEYVECQGNRRE